MKVRADANPFDPGYDDYPEVVTDTKDRRPGSGHMTLTSAIGSTHELLGRTTGLRSA